MGHPLGIFVKFIYSWPFVLLCDEEIVENETTYCTGERGPLVGHGYIPCTLHREHLFFLFFIGTVMIKLISGRCKNAKTVTCCLPGFSARKRDVWMPQCKMARSKISKWWFLKTLPKTWHWKLFAFAGSVLCERNHMTAWGPAKKTLFLRWDERVEAWSLGLYTAPSNFELFQEAIIFINSSLAKYKRFCCCEEIVKTAAASRMVQTKSMDRLYTSTQAYPCLSIDWLINWVFVWLFDCLIVWLIDWSIDWLIDRLIDFFFLLNSNL